MKFVTALIFTVALAISAAPQTAMQALATANGRSFTAHDLSPNVAEAWIKLPNTLAKVRKSLLEKLIEEVLIKTEADKQKLPVGMLIDKEVTKKVPNPTETEIKNVYDINKSQLGDATLAKIRPQIVSFLRKPKEESAYSNFVKSLQEKYPTKPGKDVNSYPLVASDVLAAVGERKLLYAEYFRKNALAIYEIEANIFDAMYESLEQVVDSALYASEAQSLQISTSDYISREITDKLKTYTNEETTRIQSNLRKILHKKYRVRYFVKEPKPFIQNISADDDPFIGKADAPITIVMFTDFQCPGCSATYPVLKKLVDTYNGKVRLVVRDYPLTSIHENAFQAAVAANAANAQGKFFRFKEILYKNQDSLDTESLKKYAAEAGLKFKKFRKDLRNKKFAAEIRKDMADGKRYGVSGTPSIFVNGYKIRNLSVRSFRKAIERALGNKLQ